MVKQQSLKRKALSLRTYSIFFFIIHPLEVMKSIQCSFVFLNWLEDGLYHCSYRSWKPEHSWCQSKSDKWVWGALLQPVCHHRCDKHGSDLNRSNLHLPSAFLPVIGSSRLHGVFTLSKFAAEIYGAWEKCKKAFYITKCFICHLLQLARPWKHRFHSAAAVVNTCAKQSTVTETFLQCRHVISKHFLVSFLKPVGAIVRTQTAATTTESVCSLRASCNGTPSLRWVTENDMHRCSGAGNQYNRLPSMNLSQQPDDARLRPPVNRGGSQKLYYSLSSSHEDTRRPREKPVCHLAGRASFYGRPTSPGNKSLGR